MLAEKARERLAKARPTSSTSFAEYYDDPAGFFRDILDVELWDKQAEIAQSVAANTHTVGRSGHKVGKSVAASGLALWWVNTREQGQVILTSSGERQVKGILWKELRRLWRRAHRRGHDVGPEPALDPATGLRLGDGVRAIHGFTTATPEMMAGFSGHELLFIIDEASGFPDDIYEAVEGNTAGGGRVLALGNPTQTTGWFFEAFRSHATMWQRFHISSEDTPNVLAGKMLIPGLATIEWRDMMREKYGPDYTKNPTYMVRVLGEFPEHASNSAIGLATVTEARERWGAPPASGLLTIGVDVARFGDDETVIQPVRGTYAYEPTTLAGADGPTVAAHVMGIARRLAGPDPLPPIHVDGIGVGASVVDACKQLKLPVAEINVGENATDPDYTNLRSQLWFGLGAWLADGGAIPPSDRMEQELLAPRYGFDKRGRMAVESKDEIRKRIKRSPDRADALALAVYRAPIPSNEVEVVSERIMAGSTFRGGGIRGAF